MSAYTYLSVNALTALFPAIFSFTRRWGGDAAEWRRVALAILLPAPAFIAWDAAFTRAGIWDFNPAYVMGGRLLGLPLEEILFFLCIPFACLFIYRCLPERLPWEPPTLRPLWGGLAALASAAAALSAAAGAGRPYSLAVASLASLATAWLAWRKPSWSPRFLAAAVLHYLPFLLVNGILTALPVVRYHEDRFSGLRVFTIPVEDAVFSFLLLFANVAVYESFRARARGPA